MLRQFASESSSVQRLVVITVRDLATTVAAGSTAVTVTGAVATIAGINVCVEGGCVSRHAGESVGRRLNDSPGPLPL